jgi:hypothetical protein
LGTIGPLTFRTSARKIRRLAVAVLMARNLRLLGAAPPQFGTAIM